MLKATNTVSNLWGEDRDSVVLRERIKKEQKQSLPSAEDLDKTVEEQEIATNTSLESPV